MSKCKYYLEKEVVSYDGGITWNETGVTRKGNLYEEGSEDCTDPSVQYRWINMDVTTDYICDGTNKYYKQKKQVSYDGLIWQDVTPAEYQRGSIYEVNSPDCQPTYRWVNLDISTDWICDETTYTKYYKQKKQVSYGGQEWQDVIPYEYQRGDVYETQSTDCGYVVLPKFQATYSGGQTTYEKECDGNATLTTGDTRPSGYEYSAMTTAIIGECVTSIDTSALLGTNITNINIPNSVTSIGNSAFAYCSNLPTVIIPSSVTSIGSGAFEQCSGLTSINIPNSVTEIGAYVFERCISLTNINIPNSVTSIGTGAFIWCSGMTSVTLGNSVTSIGNSAFNNCISLTNINIPNSVTSIGSNAFYGCTSLTSITVPSGVTSISNNVFRECSGLTSITIPSSVTSIGGSAFRDCSSLTEITIPNSVTSIGNYTFRYCTGLASIRVEATTPPTLGGNAFQSTNDCPIYVPASSVEAYKSASGWSSYSSRIQPIA